MPKIVIPNPKVTGEIPRYMGIGYTYLVEIPRYMGVGYINLGKIPRCMGIRDINLGGGNPKVHAN